MKKDGNELKKAWKKCDYLWGLMAWERHKKAYTKFKRMELEFIKGTK